MYYDTSLKESRRDWSKLSSPGVCHVFFKTLFLLWKKIFESSLETEEMGESDGVSSTQRSVGSDTVEDTEERDIRVMPIVTTLSFVRAVKDKTRGVRVNLT